MNGMKYAIIICTALSLMYVENAFAQQGTPKPDDAAVPKGHEQFFKALSALGKKYPKSAARFTVVDPKPDPQAGSFHACCEWSLGTPRHCERECKE
jgi:hypothetical protein